MDAVDVSPAASETLDLIEPDERADLERLVRSLVGAGGGAGDGARLVAALEHLAPLYVDARVAGLCHEGGLERVQDAFREGVHS